MSATNQCGGGGLAFFHCVCQMVVVLPSSALAAAPFSPSREPLVGCLIVPTSCRLASALAVNASPPWQVVHWAANTGLPAAAAAVSVPSALRCGLAANLVSDAANAASASRSGLSPAFLS